MTETRLFSSRELIEAAGCTRKALRYYQGKHLIHPIRQTGNKRYDEVAVFRLRLIVSLRDAGLSVGEITRLLAEVVDIEGPERAARLTDELDRVVAAIEERIDGLRKAQAQLAESRQNLLGCATCDQPPERCGTCEQSEQHDTISRALMSSG